MPLDMTQESGTDPTVPDLFHAGSAWTTLTRQRIGHTQGDQPGAALSKVDTRMACFVHVVHRVHGTAMAVDIDSVGKTMPTCRHQQHGNREGPFFPFAST